MSKTATLDVSMRFDDNIEFLGGTLESKDTGSFTSNRRDELVMKSSRALTAAEN